MSCIIILQVSSLLIIVSFDWHQIVLIDAILHHLTLFIIIGINCHRLVPIGFIRYLKIIGSGEFPCSAKTFNLCKEKEPLIYLFCHCYDFDLTVTKSQGNIYKNSNYISIDESKKVRLSSKDSDLYSLIYGFKVASQLGVHWECLPEQIRNYYKVIFKCFDLHSFRLQIKCSCIVKPVQSKKVTKV